MTIIEQKIIEKFENRYKASKKIPMRYDTLSYWCKENPKNFTPLTIKKIAKALNIDADELRKEIINQ